MTHGPWWPMPTTVFVLFAIHLLRCSPRCRKMSLAPRLLGQQVLIESKIDTYCTPWNFMAEYGKRNQHLLPMQFSALQLVIGQNYHAPKQDALVQKITIHLWVQTASLTKFWPIPSLIVNCVSILEVSRFNTYIPVESLLKSERIVHLVVSSLACWHSALAC